MGLSAGADGQAAGMIILFIRSASPNFPQIGRQSNLDFS
jgi:hypothetical protein